jgi:hypothetical protein
MSLSEDIGNIATGLLALQQRGDLGRADVVAALAAQLVECAERARALERLAVPAAARPAEGGPGVVSLEDARRQRIEPGGGSR